MSALESIAALSLALGLSLGGALVALSSARGAFLVVGIGAAAMTLAFLRLVLGGLDRRTVAGAGAADADAQGAQAHETSPHGLATLVQAGSPPSVPLIEHLKSDVESTVKYDRD